MRERGSILIENLVSVTILGVAIVILLGGLAMAITGSDYHRRQSTADTIIRSYAEVLISQASTPYVNCAGSYSPANVSVPSEFRALIDNIDYWNGSSYADTCGTDGGMQRIDIRVTSADGRDTEKVSIVKRKP